MKILFVGEFSKIGSGYGKITNELITRFYNDGYEVAELATFCHKDDERIKSCPWKVYPNLPSTEEEKQEYDSNKQNSNGKWKFEQVLLDFKPTHVFGNGDPFFYEYQYHSPFRNYFNWIITAPVDGVPQHDQWREFFDNADGLTTYTHWAKKVLNTNNIKVDVVTPPVASSDYFPIPQKNIDDFKNMLGISNQQVIGTVMRNQPRKLFDLLFESFAEVLKRKPNTILYCHTTYPDGGWDFSELLIKHKIASRVMFTYKCEHCKNTFPSFFQDLLTYCGQCGKTLCRMPDGQNPVPTSTLNKIFNLFDLYIQLASREGFGIPQIEAASCDIPVCSVNYAGMKDVIDYIGAYPIKVIQEYLGFQMNMMESVPCKKSVVDNMLIGLSNREKGSGKFLKKYNDFYQSWDKTYQDFRNLVESLPIKQWQEHNIDAPPEYNDLPHLSNEDYAKHMVINILQEKPNTYLMSRMINDLNYGITFGGICGNYFTESLNKRDHVGMNRKKLYNICLKKRMFKDYWQNQLNNEKE